MMQAGAELREAIARLRSVHDHEHVLAREPSVKERMSLDVLLHAQMAHHLVIEGEARVEVTDDQGDMTEAVKFHFHSPAGIKHKININAVAFNINTAIG